MGITTKSNMFYPEVFQDAISGAFPDIKALVGTGAVTLNTSMPWGQDRVGEKVKVPYFGSLGELDDVTNDGDALVPATLSASVEEALVKHSGKAFEITKWGSDGVGDPYAEGAAQMMEATQRRIDRELISQAKAAPLLLDDSANTIKYDSYVNALMMFGDQQQDLALMVTPSKVFGDMLKLKDLQERPLLVIPTEGKLATFLGVPVLVSDALTANGFGAITATGATPPTITVSGTPTSSAYRFVIKATKAGARGTSEIAWSSDGGVTFSAPIVTAATIALGDTGATIAIATGDAATDNVWTFEMGIYESLLCKKGAFAAWINGTPTVETDKDILTDSRIAAVHLYWLAHRYQRLPGSSKGGVVRLRTK